MYKSLALLSGMLLLITASCARLPQPAQLISVTPEYQLGMDLKDERWQIQKKAPEFLVEEMAEHMGHEMEKTHPAISLDQLREATEKRLSVDDLFIFNHESHARMVIDFSPLRPGESRPSKKTIVASANYAGQALSAEEGVSKAAYKTVKFHLPGAIHAHRLEADYTHHNERIKLIGIVGFADPYWFYFYYTDPLADAADLVSMESLIQSFVLVPTVPR